ncbi:hypothetical protein F5141DRAFT_1223548 [Pisolithus sp. B1]|nr:hypothetical protein F5141DRAFT_1223548 [Pisolithus sp. B1]KAI6113951.1 hypothetical protein EV401DRAFT_2074222 [Pisolithus croceorrhizus]
MSGLKLDFGWEYDGGTTEELDVDMAGEIEHLDDAEFGWRLAEMAAKEDDEGVDWLPEWLCQCGKQTMKHKSDSMEMSPQTDGMPASTPEAETGTDLEPWKEVDDGVSEREDSGAEDWEEELEVTMKPGSGTPTWNWVELHDQIKADLKKHSKTLPLLQVHQLLILSNFATLWLKGVSQIGASLEIARQW